MKLEEIQEIPLGQPLSYHNGRKWVRGRYWFEKTEDHQVHVRFLQRNETTERWEKTPMQMHEELFLSCFRMESVPIHRYVASK